MLQSQGSDDPGIQERDHVDASGLSTVCDVRTRPVPLAQYKLGTIWMLLLSRSALILYMC